MGRDHWHFEEEWEVVRHWIRSIWHNRNHRHRLYVDSEWESRSARTAVAIRCSSPGHKSWIERGESFRCYQHSSSNSSLIVDGFFLCSESFAKGFLLKWNLFPLQRDDIYAKNHRLSGALQAKWQQQISHSHRINDWSSLLIMAGKGVETIDKDYWTHSNYKGQVQHER